MELLNMWGYIVSGNIYTLHIINGSYSIRIWGISEGHITTPFTCTALNLALIKAAAVSSMMAGSHTGLSLLPPKYNKQ